MASSIDSIACQPHFTSSSSSSVFLLGRLRMYSVRPSVAMYWLVADQGWYSESEHRKSNCLNAWEDGESAAELLAIESLYRCRTSHDKKSFRNLGTRSGNRRPTVKLYRHDHHQHHLKNLIAGISGKDMNTRSTTKRRRTAAQKERPEKNKKKRVACYVQESQSWAVNWWMINTGIHAFIFHSSPI